MQVVKITLLALFCVLAGANAAFMTSECTTTSSTCAIRGGNPVLPIPCVSHVDNQCLPSGDGRYILTRCDADGLSYYYGNDPTCGGNNPALSVGNFNSLCLDLGGGGYKEWTCCDALFCPTCQSKHMYEKP